MAIKWKPTSGRQRSRQSRDPKYPKHVAFHQANRRMPESIRAKLKTTGNAHVFIDQRGRHESLMTRFPLEPGELRFTRIALDGFRMLVNGGLVQFNFLLESTLNNLPGFTDCIHAVQNNQRESGFSAHSERHALLVKPSSRSFPMWDWAIRRLSGHSQLMSDPSDDRKSNNDSVMFAQRGKRKIDDNPVYVATENYRTTLDHERGLRLYSWRIGVGGFQDIQTVMTHSASLLAMPLAVEFRCADDGEGTASAIEVKASLKDVQDDQPVLGLIRSLRNLVLVKLEESRDSYLQQLDIEIAYLLSDHIAQAIPQKETREQYYKNQLSTILWKWFIHVANDQGLTTVHAIADGESEEIDVASLIDNMRLDGGWRRPFSSLTIFIDEVKIICNLETGSIGFYQGLTDDEQEDPIHLNPLMWNLLQGLSDFIHYQY